MQYWKNYHVTKIISHFDGSNNVFPDCTLYNQRGREQSALYLNFEMYKSGFARICKNYTLLFSQKGDPFAYDE